MKNCRFQGPNSKQILGFGFLFFQGYTGISTNPIRENWMTVFIGRNPVGRDSEYLITSSGPV